MASDSLQKMYEKIAWDVNFLTGYAAMIWCPRSLENNGYRGVKKNIVE